MPLKKLKEGLGIFCYKFRYAIIAVFAALFIAASIGQSFLGVAFSEPRGSYVLQVFPSDTIVVLYNNNDEARINELIEFLQADENVRSVHGFANTPLGIPQGAAGIAEAMDMPIQVAEQVFAMAGVNLMSLFDFVMFMAASEYLPDPPPEQTEMMIAARSQLIGQEFSRLIVTLGYTPETAEINTFYDNFTAEMTRLFEHDFFLIGETAMSHELSQTFGAEYLFISLLLTAALFAALAIAFRKFLLPLLLLGVVQCAMFVMMSAMAITGIPIYFLALLIVQSVIKGASLEWGVLLANSYIEARGTLPKRQALIEAILKSSRVTLTSALIMIVTTTSLGLIMSGAVASIMFGIGIASAASAFLIMLVLPSLLVVFDKFVIKKQKPQVGTTAAVA